MSTEIHEASHCAAAILLGRRVEHTWREVGSSLPGETLGHARIPITTLDGTQVVIALIGYLSTDAENWPPDFESALTEEREGLKTILRRLHATEEQYEQTIAFCRELLTDPDFLTLRDAIARALATVPRLEAEDIEALCRATDTPIPEPGVPA